MLNLHNPSLLATQCYINGSWIDADSRLEVTNPATGITIATVPILGRAESKQAIIAAHAAGQTWRNTSATERAHLLRAWHDLILANRYDLAQILTCEQGKPVAEAEAEIRYGASYIEWFAEEARRIQGDIIAAPSRDKRLITLKQPVGVVGAITPWNFPNAMLTRKIAPALAAGCTIVCRPASETPLSALALGVLAEKAGIPAGVLNIVTGARDIATELTENPLVRKITFTGSTPVGKQLLQQSATTCKRTSMELGGNAAFIVFEDADLEAAIEGALKAKFRNAGQTCVSANRFLVHTSIYDHFITKLAARVKDYHLGDGLNPNTTLGPLINPAAVKKVAGIVEDALAKGATLITGGKQATQGPCFYEPTVLGGVNASMKAFNEEIFGPVAAVCEFSTEAEAIAMANHTNQGLANYFYTGDTARQWRVAEALECGIVGINEGIVSNAMAPFGGVKESGHGREGSSYGIQDYLDIKYVCIGGLA